MLEGAGGLGFTLEALEQVRVIGKVAGHHLDGDRPADTGVNRLIDDAHAAFAEHVGDVVLPNFLQLTRRHHSDPKTFSDLKSCSYRYSRHRVSQTNRTSRAEKIRNRLAANAVPVHTFQNTLK